MTSILIAEDDDRLAALLLRSLGGAGFLTERVADGLAARTAMLSGRFDLVLLDVGLPLMSGLEVLADVRPSMPELAIILVTADNIPSHIVGGLNTGADDYVTKPIRFDELLARINARLRLARVHENRVTSGGMTLDLVARAVTTPRGLVDLPTREFELLEYLMRRPERVVGRGELMREIWGYETERSSNVVDVYVGYLRQKLGADAIETVRGAGYRIRS
ncbi:response regulator transcription factor [Pseudolysinimonas sp.]|uniref:response regulator transcription factor n=1 Tax=Pseudolysinimonas sp. TaxID=2680009 RepID=UPI003F7E4F53